MRTAASYGLRMPFRRASATPDLERVAQVLGGGRPGPGPAPTTVETADARSEVVARARRDGWVPRRPGGDDSSAELAHDLGLPPGADDELERLEADLRRARRPAVLTAPDQLRLGRWSVSSAAVVAVLALVVALGCALAIRILWAERVSDGQVPSDSAAGSPGSTGPSRRGVTVSPVESGSTRATGVLSGGSTAGPTEVVVHVVGQVARPGLVRLRQGARVADAIDAAGGARSGADVAALNLARVVVDGEQVYVPKPGEAFPPASAGGGSGGGPSGGGGPDGTGGGVVNLNTADLATLDTLPGVGPVLAQRIVDWRAEHGRFSSVDELGEVSGIGDKLMAQLRPKVTV